MARVLGVLGALEPRKYRDGVARGAGDRSSPRRRLADASPPPASDTIGGGLGSAGGMTRGEALTAEALAAQAIVGGGGLVVATAAAAGGGGGGGGIADRFALDSHPPGSTVYLAGFALLQLLSILHDNALATAPPENPPSRLYLELARSPVITRDRPRLLEITRDYPRPLEITRDQPRSSEITRDHSRLLEITRDYEMTRDYSRSPEITR